MNLIKERTPLKKYFQIFNINIDRRTETYRRERKERLNQCMRYREAEKERDRYVKEKRKREIDNLKDMFYRY
jgi:hypothetical protein